MQDIDPSERFRALIDAAASILGDGVDHPNVWAVLCEHVTLEHGPAFIAFVEAILPLQDDLRIIKALRLIHAVSFGVAVDEQSGIAKLGELEGSWPNCTEIAGAKFFLRNLSNPDRPPNLIGKFCEAPFTKFETLIDGSVAPCCSIWTKKRLGQLADGGLEACWNSQSAQEMRASILDGSFRYCNKERCTLIMEDALPDADEVTDPGLRNVIGKSLVILDERPRWLFLGHDLTCNLACPSCRDQTLGLDKSFEKPLQKIEEQVIHPILHSENKVKLSVSGQGDPWSSPHYRSILKYIANRELNIDLDIHTNGLLMTESRWSEYSGLEKYRPLVNISIDSCTPWVYEILRRPGKWATLHQNLIFIASRRAAGAVSEMHLNATVQADNYHELPDMVAFAAQLGADTIRFYMIQNTGGHLAASYPEKNIGNPNHPLHLAFLETLRHPILGGSIAHLYDVANWRENALQASLPSDRLGREYSQSDLLQALGETIRTGAFATTVALCAAGRIRFPSDIGILRAEADALSALGFDRLSAYRQREIDAVTTKGAPEPVIPISSGSDLSDARRANA
ncbi:SPASM domain-containing protein [Pleomorphomonas sp. PLEO]|uniref:SPASM domain-containing protein n=1 Tax=Pleomorphomonas sp. PLEO TaxID=3239306 RepID=UPI00351F3F55